MKNTSATSRRRAVLSLHLLGIAIVICYWTNTVFAEQPPKGPPSDRETLESGIGGIITNLKNTLRAESPGSAALQYVRYIALPVEPNVDKKGGCENATNLLSSRLLTSGSEGSLASIIADCNKRRTQALAIAPVQQCLVRTTRINTERQGDEFAEVHVDDTLRSKESCGDNSGEYQQWLVSLVKESGRWKVLKSALVHREVIKNTIPLKEKPTPTPSQVERAIEEEKVRKARHEEKRRRAEAYFVKAYQKEIDRLSKHFLFLLEGGYAMFCSDTFYFPAWFKSNEGIDRNIIRTYNMNQFGLDAIGTSFQISAALWDCVHRRSDNTEEEEKADKLREEAKKMKNRFWSEVVDDPDTYYPSNKHLQILSKTIDFLEAAMNESCKESSGKECEKQ